ncbi:MAG: VOC family protein [Acidobacteriota bacterium]
MIKYGGVHHLAMATGNMDETIRFWRDLLGMRLVVGLGRPGYRHYFFEVSGNTFIAFFEWPGVEPVPEKDHGFPVSGPFLFDHVSFEVETEEDLWNLKARLEGADVWVSEAVDHGFLHSIYSFDPNGIPIEFSYNVRSLDVRKHPVMVDQTPSAKALEGPEPRPDVWPSVNATTPLEDRKVYPGEGRELVEGVRRNWFKAD